MTKTLSQISDAAPRGAWVTRSRIDGSSPAGTVDLIIPTIPDETIVTMRADAAEYVATLVNAHRSGKVVLA